MHGLGTMDFCRKMRGPEIPVGGIRVYLNWLRNAFGEESEAIEENLDIHAIAKITAQSVQAQTSKFEVCACTGWAIILASMNVQIFLDCFTLLS